MVKIKEWITEVLIIKEYDLGSITENNDFCKIFTVVKLGHGELLELRLLEKSARHDFIIARHRSSSWRVFDELLDNELICGSTGFEQ